MSNGEVMPPGAVIACLAMGLDSYVKVFREVGRAEIKPVWSWLQLNDFDNGDQSGRDTIAVERPDQVVTA